MVGGFIAVPDGVYNIDRLNSVILDGTLFAIKLSDSGLYYGLYEYASEGDKANDENGTEIVGHEGESALNKQIYDNNLYDRIKFVCNVFNTNTNELEKG